MPIPTDIATLSPDPGANSPGGGEASNLVDNYLRQLMAFVAQLRDSSATSAALAATSAGLAAALQARLASTAAGDGAALVGFDWALIPAAINRADWGTRTAANGVNVLRYIPPSEWAAIFAHTSTTDVTAYINAALSGNPNVYAPAGKYRVTTIVPKYGNTLSGDGRHSDGTEFYSTSNLPIISFGGAEAGGLNVGFVTLENFRLTGLGAAGALQHGIRVVPQQSFCTVRGLHIVACGGSGIDFRGTVTAAGNDQWTIKDNKIEQCAEYGIAVDTQLATSIFEQNEIYANSLGGVSFQSTAGYKLDNNLFVRMHVRNNGSTAGNVAHGFFIGAGVQNCTWINSWCEANGESPTIVDTTHTSAGYHIAAGGNATLKFINCKNSVQSRGFKVTNSTTGVTIDNPSSLLMAGFRSSGDIIIDPGSAAEIINPTSDGALIIAIADNKSRVLYHGVAIPSATTRIPRGAEHRFNDGTTTRFLAGGATAGTFGGGTWAGTAGTNTISGSISHSLRIGDHVRIPGAGAAGATLEAYIIDMSASTLVATLDRNIVTTVAAAAVVNGDRMPSQGSFTCIVSGSSTAGAGSGYSGQNGTYTIDEYGYATVNYAATWTGHTGTGVITVPLPITCAESNFAAVLLSGYTYGAGNSPVAAIYEGGTSIQLQKYSDGGAAAALALDTAGTIRGNIRFKVSVPV